MSGLNPRTFAYDSLSRLTSATNPESGRICYGTVSGGACQANGYDANSNLVTKTDARGIATTFRYDALNRLTGKTYSDGTPAATFNYDQSSALGVTLINTKGRKSSQSTTGPNATGSVFSYDRMGRISNNSQCTPQNCGTGVFAFQYTQYDLVGDLISATNAAGVTFNYAYNTAARLTGITTNFIDSSHPGTLFSSAHYSPFGGLTSATLGNSVTESWSYNKRGWQQSRTARFGAATPYSFSVSTFAPNGDILAANDRANGNWAYTYDAFNRLLSANATGQAYTYDYDRFGNRWHQNGPHSSQLGFDANNRITGVTGVGYDLAGNLTSDGSGPGSHTYFYDAESRLIQVDGTLGTCSTATACYVYNADGQRVRKTTGGSSMDYLYDLAGHKVADVDPTGVFMRGELYARDRHFAIYAPEPGPTGATFFTHSDWLGTERVRTAMTGTNCESIASLPFGDGQSFTGTCGDVSPMHFTGKERDSESGLDNFGARYDSSSLGRFITPDWSASPEAVPYAKLDDPQSLNLYSYVKNNPLTLSDPDGHKCKKDKDGNFHGDTCGQDTGTGSTPDKVIVRPQPLPQPRAPSFMDYWRAYRATNDPDFKRYLIAKMLGISAFTVPTPVGQDTLGPPTGGLSIPTNLLEALGLLDLLGSPPPGWEWRGSGPPGSSDGSWYNPSTGEYLHPDPQHPDPIGPHWDYRDPQGKLWRVYPDKGTMTPK